MNPERKEIYTSLAPLYDTLMGDVDYESWADFIDEIMQTHHFDPIEILELACGTGSLALSLAELECYTITATDLSPSMVDVARGKAAEFESDVNFFPMNYLNINLQKKFDCIYTVFDSVNYLKKKSEVKLFLENSYKILKPGGLLIFDFSTPKNSLQSVDYLNNEEGDAGRFRYLRSSRYDAKEKIHYNEFEIDELDEQTGKVINTFREVHTQRAYSLNEMLLIVEQTPYHQVAKYDGFDLIDADENSARVTMVLKCQTQQ
ncbi:MAG: class I SAM-dependent methyltransferase [Balneolaceae bacterium]|nr:class I SAM-dependent methyltransferase [Balneolaceae bacterium]MBO6546351.1 class I SAM-dependent methyltransferase [Balneolaceae bacterium]MBO6648710.1 class I SAM-dependent methyltransferase [Balneolaceae bacterium]